MIETGLMPPSSPEAPQARVWRAIARGTEDREYRLRARAERSRTSLPTTMSGSTAGPVLDAGAGRIHRDARGGRNQCCRARRFERRTPRGTSLRSDMGPTVSSQPWQRAGRNPGNRHNYCTSSTWTAP